MKKIFYTVIVLLGLSILTNCSKDSNGIIPTSLDASKISYEAKPGAVKLKWSIPENANYQYIKIGYRIPENIECIRLASVYSDTILIDNVLKKYGEIEYTLQPFSDSGIGGDINKINAQCEAATASIAFENPSPLVKIPIDKNHVWTDSQESSEGPIANLVDDDATGTYFHMSWSKPTDFPHYIVMDVGDPIQAITFSYVCRNHNNRDNPKEIEILVSNEFNPGENYTAQEAALTTLIGKVSGLPDTKAASYQAASAFGLKSREGFRYVWFKILSSTSGNRWLALSDWKVYKAKKIIDDPEVGGEEILE